MRNYAWSMAFHQPPPAGSSEPGPAEPDPPWSGPPSGWLGGIANGPILLGRGRAVVALRMIEAFPTGCSLHVRVYSRRPSAFGAGEWAALRESVLGDGPPHSTPTGEQDGKLRIGVQLGNGTRVTAMAHFSSYSDPPPQPILVERTSSADWDDWQLSSDRSVWLWPLPGVEPFEIVVEWPLAEIPPTHTAISGMEVDAAADRAQQLWTGS